MKWTFAGLGAIIAGIFGFVMIDLFNNVTVTNENEYYLLKEVTEASMIDAIDIAYYRTTGELKIVKEKFIESFLGRYADAITYSRGNKFLFEFYDIMESPPKVSIIAKSNTGVYNIFEEGTDFSIENALTAILEYGEGCWVKASTTMLYVSSPWMWKEETECNMTEEKATRIQTPEIFKNEIGSIRNVEAEQPKYVKSLKTQAEINLRYFQEALMYAEPVPREGSYDIDELVEKYLATDITYNNDLKYNPDTGKVTWSASYKCSDKEEELNDDTCMVGIIYEVKWNYEVYSYSAEKDECIKE